jgi:putative Mn2+ efflux pump MntP
MTDRKKLFIDYGFITALWILVGIYLYDVIFQGFIGNMNNYFAFGLLLAVTLSNS